MKLQWLKRPHSWMLWFGWSLATIGMVWLAAAVWLESAEPWEAVLSNGSYCRFHPPGETPGPDAGRTAAPSATDR